MTTDTSLPDAQSDTLFGDPNQQAENIGTFLNEAVDRSASQAALHEMSIFLPLICE